jgi:serine/threonine-protein kinase
MDVLVYLADHSGEVLSKELIIGSIWPETFVTDEVLTNAISELRKAFADDAKNPRVIETIPRRGYRLIAEVSFVEEEDEKALEPYQIIRKLGEGGMGEVHLAQDTILKRPVALKFIRPEKEADDIWHRRLKREARAAASLDHPYICKIYETGSLNGRNFIAMEYVEGESLSKRLAKGALPLAEALRIGLEITEALEVAHRHGIAHRDIKPSNVILTDQGHVKITDFGIATRFRKLTADEGEWSLTETAEQITGTPDYMSPEQLLREPVDHRTDQFLLGMVIYEMVTGVHPFRRRAQAETTAAILKEDPEPLAEYLEEPSELLQYSVTRMLAKAPEDRYSSASEISANLNAIIQGTGEHLKLQSSSQISRWNLPAVAAVLMVLALFVSWFVFDRGPTAPTRQATGQVFRSQIDLPPETSLSGGIYGRGARPIRREIVISPEGDLLIFSATSLVEPRETRLYRRPLHGDQAEPISGTEGGRQPFFSPDGNSIGFWADGWLKKVPIDGGIPVPLAELSFDADGETPYPPAGAFWAEDGRILLGDVHGGLQWIPDEGGSPEPLTELDETREVRHVMPWVLPDGDTVLFTTTPSFWGTSAQIEVLALSSGERRLLLEDAADACYVQTGHLVFMRQGQLMAVPFDLENKAVVGSAIPIQNNIQQAMNLGLSEEHSTAGQFWVSNTGALVYGPGGVGKPVPGELVWMDRQGHTQRVEGFDNPLAGQLDLSPDGRKIAFSVLGGGGLWVFDRERATHSLLFEAAGSPVWSPDSRKVAFGHSVGGVGDTWTVSVDRREERRRLTEGGTGEWPSSWSPNGKHLAIVSEADIYMYSFENSTLTTFLATPSAEAYPEFSPDGRWLAYTSDETGREEVYVTAFPDRVQTLMISNQGGSKPIWSASSPELFYFGSKSIFKVDMHSGERLSPSVPQILIDYYHPISVWRPITGFSYDSEGERFLLVRSDREAAVEQHQKARITHLNLVTNWFSELNRIVPADD